MTTRLCLIEGVETASKRSLTVLARQPSCGSDDTRLLAQTAATYGLRAGASAIAAAMEAYMGNQKGPSPAGEAPGLLLALRV